MKKVESGSGFAAAWFLSAALLLLPLLVSSCSDETPPDNPGESDAASKWETTVFPSNDAGERINRYYGNLLGREGYFMFSLPVRSSTLMVSKTLSAMIWTAFGTIVGFAAVAMVSIVAFNGTDYIEFKQALHMFYKEIISPNIGHVIFWIAIMILVLVTVIVRVYAAVAIGSQWSGHRLLGSVLAYVGIKIVETIIASVISSVDFLKNGVEHLMWNSPADVNGFTNWRLQIVVLAIIAIQIVIYWVLAWYFTDRRLNLE